MSDGAVSQIIGHIVQKGPLEDERFAELLGTTLAPSDQNPYWRFYTFQMGEGPFAGGELRINAKADAALLILEPRDPPGLLESDIDRTSLGQRVGMRPNLRIPPEGIETETFDREGVKVSVQWTYTSRRLRSLVFEWIPEPSPPDAAE
jgi:hypothetical protein